MDTCEICELAHKTALHYHPSYAPIKIEALPVPRKDEIDTLIEYWHTSKVHSHVCYERMQYTVRWFCKKYPDVKPTVAYKWLEQQIS